ncbi:MAG: 5-(carboxyamino)imidazole ribonucleotide mutase [Armatimonadota bacterium]|nr:5-(carboxyamino)imidazole ribonucleotide mutase [Armatimonadota bacterium]
MGDGAPLVGIVMGSESDLEVMRPCAELLSELGVAYEMRVMSAHRTPDLVAEWASGAAERGLKVVIAGAGAAAALPGCLAAQTTLPVIGVPIDATALRAVDALYSMVQMPSGVPVATVSIDGATNAAVLAARILAIEDAELAGRLEEMTAACRAEVIETDRRVHGEAQ